MHIEEVTSKLIESNYQLESHKKFQEYMSNNSLQMWIKGSRVIFVKEYEAKSILYKWYINDQPIIASIYNDLPSECKNNIYFFMVLNFETLEDDNLNLEINKIVKDEHVCRKYVFQSIEEIDDVPFLSNHFIKHEQFDYEEEFKKNMLSLNGNELNKEKIDEYNILAKNLLNYYFDSYINLNNKEEDNMHEKKITDIGNRSIDQ